MAKAKKKTTKQAEEKVEKENKKVTKKTPAKKKEVVKKEVAKKEKPKKTTPVKKKEPVKKEVVKKETKPAPEPKEFVAMCGAKFNADPSSTCFLMCKEENKDDFQNCLSNYETIQKTKPAGKKKLNRRKKKIDYFGDGVGTSASMINALLICGASMAEIQEELEVKKSRVNGHFGGLRTKDSIKTRTKSWAIFRCKETNRYFFDEPNLPYHGNCDDCGNTSAN